MQIRFPAALIVALLGLAAAAKAATPFSLQSSDISEGQQMSSAQVANVFGCSGENFSPELTWSGAPTGTKSFVLTVYDPDAPTGSGFWHWSVANIPAAVTRLPAAMKADAKLGGAVQVRNDYGSLGFGGACPPPGKPHRYIFTIYALSVEKLDVTPDTTPAVVGFMTLANTIGHASLTATYGR